MPTLKIRILHTGAHIVLYKVAVYKHEDTYMATPTPTTHTHKASMDTTQGYYGHHTRLLFISMDSTQSYSSPVWTFHMEQQGLEQTG